MKKTVFITIQGTQQDKEHQETTETIYRGECLDAEQKAVVSYEETYPDETENTTASAKNIMTIEEASVSLVKKGYITTEMLFQKGYTHHGLYRTPFGAFRMVIRTSNLRIDRQPDQCNLLIDYSLELNGQFISGNHLAIQIRDDRQT